MREAALSSLATMILARQQLDDAARAFPRRPPRGSSCSTRRAVLLFEPPNKAGPSPPRS
jgi:hypothetical protein